LVIASEGYFNCYEGKQSPGTGLGAACEANVIRNTLYKDGYKTNKLRIVCFSKEHVANRPASLYHIPYFDAFNNHEFDNLVAWMNGTDNGHHATSSGESQQQQLVNWPPALQNYEPDLANRQAEFAFFSSFLTGATSERAIFFEAPSNHGKTILVSEFISYARQALGKDFCVAIDFKGNPSRQAVIDSFLLNLKSSLPNFSKSKEVRDLRSDLWDLRTPILFVFDTYEQASNDAEELVQNIILADLHKMPSVRVVIAGQKAPEFEKTLWANSIREFALGLISDPSHWTRFAQRRHPKLNEVEIKTLAHATGGQPGITRSLIETLAKHYES
jgi:hypothetical protein